MQKVITRSHVCYKQRKNFLTVIHGLFLYKIKYSNILLNFLLVERRKDLKTISYLLKRSKCRVLLMNFYGWKWPNLSDVLPVK